MADSMPLSLTAQAVLDAIRDTPDHLPYEHDIAVALSTAVDQVIASVPPPCADFDEYAKGFLAAHIKYRRDLLAIAAELERIAKHPLEPTDLSHLSDEEFLALAPQGFHAP